MQIIYCDFEYIQHKTKTWYAVICGVLYNKTSGEVLTFDLRESYEEIQEYLKFLDLKQTLFYAYNIATAEVPVFCQIMGRDFVSKMRWGADLWTEYKMFALTHPKYFNQKTGLLSAISGLGLEGEYKASKGDTLKLILSKIEGVNEYLISTVQNLADKSPDVVCNLKQILNYTPEEFNNILFYCKQDVMILPKIAQRLVEISKEYPIKMDHWRYRAEHCKWAGISYFYQKGYPVDENKVKTIFENIPRIKTLIQEQCNTEAGFKIYVAKFKGPAKMKVPDGHAFNMRNFRSYLESKGLLQEWQLTEKGYLRLDEEYLDEMCSQYKTIIEPMYNARNTIKQLNSTNLANIMTPEGYIKGESWPFNQKSSRSSPKPKLGFLLNLTAWLRMLVHPKPGRALVSIDFKSQEILIAALLSGDASMLEDYKSDIYLGQAIKTGFAPEGATKKTHNALRSGFKPIVLGRSYGMGPNKMAIHFFNMFKDMADPHTINECIDLANRFIQRHKSAYFTYYEFLNYIFTLTKFTGYYQTLDKWLYFTSKETRPTQLQNIPSQSNGGAMLRNAHDRCVRDGIDVVGLHDALIFECAEADAKKLARVVSKHMVDASAWLLGADYMQTDTKIYTHNCPYYDPRGEKIYRFLMAELNLGCPEEFKKPAEIVNIHEVVDNTTTL